ncbi:MAG: S-methyl-5-thioribose-1-phosphate isomerase [Saprospiraceae bacterium]|nr:S-methyl-5-thioribose-1-phosphate isomerase [Saprospiraceae bacterium]
MPSNPLRPIVPAADPVQERNGVPLNEPLQERNGVPLNRPLPTIRLHPGNDCIVQVLDQRKLPFDVMMNDLLTAADAASAIRDMQVRGAPLIGVTAAYGMYLAACAETGSDIVGYYHQAQQSLAVTRPTAVDLFAALKRSATAILAAPDRSARIAAALQTAQILAEESIAACRAIGEHGLPFIADLAKAKNGAPVNILTHCNAGYLACIEYGTATAPIYLAHENGIPVHVWVDETRPRNQGARLTAFELAQRGVPHTVIADNTGGHLMQHGLVDLLITGTDRTTRCGDVANKIGTYLKALAAFDNGIPFYVAAPSSSIDWNSCNGLRDIEIEQRDAHELRFMEGADGDAVKEVRIYPEHSPAANFAFDVTPARLVTAIITERGVCPASEEGLRRLFPK